MGLSIVLLGHTASARGPKISSNLVDVVTATFIGGQGTEWLTSATFPGNDSIILGGVSLEPELTIHGVKATVLGKDAPARAVVKRFGRFGVGGTGKTRLPKVKEQGPADEEEDLFADDGDDGGLAVKFKPTKAEREKRAREEAERKKLSILPPRFRWTQQISVEKQNIFAKFSWADQQATGFIGQFGPDLNTVQKLVRFPRGSCAISSLAVDKAGNIYVGGFADDRIKQATADYREEKSNRYQAADKNYNFGLGRFAFFARVAADLSKVDWIRAVRYRSYAPKLRVLDNGNIASLGPGYTVFSPNGKRVQVAFARFLRISSGSAIDPVTGRFTIVGDWLGRTGREPMRVPRLIVHRTDGRTFKQLYTWGSGFFCPNFQHLVADSAVRRTAYDHKGNLIWSTWSHGGNNCLGRYPWDPERHMRDAMGYTGMSTYCYISKLSPEYEVKTSFLWTSAGGVQNLAAACDQSIAWVGGAHPTWTPNALSTQRTGNMLVMAEPNLTSYRFWSAVPACGTHVVVGGCNEAARYWGMATGRCAGKPMFLYLTGAPQEDKQLEAVLKPPQKNPAQKYGGGLLDGYAVLLDLTPKTTLGMELPPPKPRPPGKPRPKKELPKNMIHPVEGQVWRIGDQECTTVMVSVRDEHDKMWPSWLSGKGVKGGTFTFGKNTPEANFTLDAPGIQQDFGDQSDRVLGELTQMIDTIDEKTAKIKYDYKGPGVGMKLHITRMSDWEQTEDLAYSRRFPCPIYRCKAVGKLEFGKEIKLDLPDVTGRISFLSPDPSRVKVDKPNYGYLDLRFQIPGKDLGLSGDLAGQKIRIRFRGEMSSHVKSEKVVDPDKVAPPPKLKDKGTDEDLGLGL